MRCAIGCVFFIEELIEGELASVLARPRYGRRAKDSGCAETLAGVAGHRHGSRTRTLTGTFGRTKIAVPRARLMQPDGGTTEWKSEALRAYQRCTLAAEALIAGAYLAGVNTRRVRRALAALFSGAVGKDIVSRTWRKVKGDWDIWNSRSLADEWKSGGEKLRRCSLQTHPLRYLLLAVPEKLRN